VGEVEAFGQGFPGDGQFVAVGLGFEALGLGGLFDFLSVLVQAGEEEDLVAEAAARAGDDIGEDLFIGVAEVRGAVDVIDRGGDVELFAHPGRIVTGRGWFGKPSEGGDWELGIGDWGSRLSAERRRGNCRELEDCEGSESAVDANAAGAVQMAAGMREVSEEGEG
jgi:hypothetical protein